ncbi:Kunitz/Bovine pancreatic trypsin inhibitor domain protein [Dictyocaulus viviparus]|uniref:Kunitz/Bovine pancreatic trypsin inhibitor domain protein n=1 Tax=Dictyocaulus viviparus TaxID=29172 RepID=A0A0D8XGP3_DICVI|nr:Kunitz/Bovine pancreatic trypsin inhibitor domain protein [Dictyocaulus viviparus]
MPRDVGQGDELLPRWYYDVRNKQCRRFLYKGIRGNMNNFFTETQCIDACETRESTDQKNPCQFGLPERYRNRTLVMCGPNNPLLCSKTHYCHFGEDPETTVCCKTSGSTDPCLLSRNVGEGNALLKRFKFLEHTSPCSTDIKPMLIKQCSLNGKNCDDGEWCHIGTSPSTTVCCPGASMDPCSLPLETGEGNHELPRWYADSEEKSCSRQCKPFKYKGFKGNQNNFLTKAACERKCQLKCKSPCGSGQMLMTEENEPHQCSPTSPCPQSHWCHVGITSEKTVCCSSVPNPCKLPMMKGFGNSHLTRWHFDKNLKKCVRFVYSGEGGNQNMFLTKEDCQTICPEFKNPCGTGKPLLVMGMAKVCNSSHRCPSTHFCHIGTNNEENYCCPKHGDPCSQVLALGKGTASLIRYHYDKESNICREFIYKGSKGNANNFLSIEDCELMCRVQNPCPSGGPLLNSLKQPVICGGQDSCVDGYWCHVGGSPETTNCCPGTRDPCDLPQEIGQGDEQLERWFFDVDTHMCQKFIYKGMKGNVNNFLTREACRQACKEINPCGSGEPLVGIDEEPVLCTGRQRVDSCPRGYYCHVGANPLTTLCCPKKGIDSCEQPVQHGTGGGNLPRWFFDKNQNRCVPFIYGGIGGNENNFISQATCTKDCPIYRNYCPHGIPLVEGDQVTSCGIDRGCPDGFLCHINSKLNVSVCCQDPVTFCTAPHDPGPCTDFETRYGYNPSSDSCEEYKYGGCDGTLNNFLSHQRCTEICCKDYKKKL